MISRSLCRCIQRQLVRVKDASHKFTPFATKKFSKLYATQLFQSTIYGEHINVWPNFRRFCSTIQTDQQLQEETPQKMLDKIKQIMGNDQCPGCGTPLQATEPELVGYIPPPVLSRVLHSSTQSSKLIDASTTTLPSDSRQHSLLCQRCYKLVHYNSPQPSRMDVLESEETLVARVTRPAIERTAPLVALLVDLGDVEGSLLSRARLKSLLPSSTPLVLVATKIDLLPHGLSETRVTEWLRARALQCGLDPRAVLLTSAVTGHNVTRHVSTGIQSRTVKQSRDADQQEQLLFDQLTRLAQGRNIVFMGVQNVGKSSLVNRLLHHVDKRHRHVTGPQPVRAPLTTSYFPGTTLAPIARALLPLNATDTLQMLYDTPGLVPNQPHLLTALMAANVHKHAQSHVLGTVVLDKRINPAVYRLRPGHSLYLGGVARLDYLAGPPLVYFTVFASHAMYVHETSAERAEEVWQSGADKFLVPVVYGEDKQPLPLRARNLTLRSTLNWKEAFVDIVWPGLGWISLTAVGEVQVRVHWALDPRGIVTREPLMPFESKRGLKPNPRFQNKPAY